MSEKSGFQRPERTVEGKCNRRLTNFKAQLVVVNRHLRYNFIILTGTEPRSPVEDSVEEPAAPSEIPSKSLRPRRRFRRRASSPTDQATAGRSAVLPAVSPGLFLRFSLVSLRLVSRKLLAENSDMQSAFSVKRMESVRSEFQKSRETRFRGSEGIQEKK